MCLVWTVIWKGFPSFYQPHFSISMSSEVTIAYVQTKALVWLNHCLVKTKDCPLHVCVHTAPPNPAGCFQSVCKPSPGRKTTGCVGHNPNPCCSSDEHPHSLHRPLTDAPCYDLCVKHPPPLTCGCILDPPDDGTASGSGRNFGGRDLAGDNG